MSWIQENKFTATLAGITAVGSAALLYLSMQQSGQEKVIRVKTKKLAKEETSLKSDSPFPSSENLSAKEQNLVDFANGATKLQDIMVKYRPESLEVFQPADFGPLLSDFRTSLNTAFEDAGTTLPERTFYGFGDYANRLPKQAATGELKYQMEASQWLFSSLAEVGPEKLINIYREPLKIETGAVKEDDRRKGRKNEPVVVYEKQPIEISFLATEKGVLQFLEKIANSEKYFFAVRAIRLRNENQAAPSESSAKFTPKAATPFGDDLFAPSGDGDGGDFLVEPEGVEDPVDGGVVETPAPAADPVPAPAAPATTGGDLILKQILGKEKVYVTMRVELIIFEPKDKVAIPRAEVASSAKDSNEETESN